MVVVKKNDLVNETSTGRLLLKLGTHASTNPAQLGLTSELVYLPSLFVIVLVVRGAKRSAERRLEFLIVSV